MKKMTAIVLCVMLIGALAGCAGGSTSTDPVGDVGNASGTEQTGNEDGAKTEADGGSVEVSAEVLEILGMSAEEFAAMDPTKQQAILEEVGVMLEELAKKEEAQQAQQTQSSVTYTPDDVMAGGSYKVVLGDYMNSITLYYEDGVLVKIVEEFQKSDEEMAEVATYEGADVANYTFNFIDWDGVSLQEILDGMKDYGGFGQYRIGKAE